MTDLIHVAAFYHFAALDAPDEKRAALIAACRRLNVRGTVLLAPEGVNGTIAGDRAAVAEILETIRGFAGFGDLEWKDSQAETMPFNRLKVRLDTM